jgi:hypothetical protein
MLTGKLLVGGANAEAAPTQWISFNELSGDHVCSEYMHDQQTSQSGSSNPSSTKKNEHMETGDGSADHYECALKGLKIGTLGYAECRVGQKRQFEQKSATRESQVLERERQTQARQQQDYQNAYNICLSKINPNVGGLDYTTAMAECKKNPDVWKSVPQTIVVPGGTTNTDCYKFGSHINCRNW